MPPKRRRRFQGLYYHSSPPKVLPMNGQSSNQGRKRRDIDDFSVKLSTIRIWMHEKDIGKLTRILWAGQGSRLCQQASTNPRVKRFLAAVPYVMNSIKDVHQAVIDNNLETLQAKMESPVPPALITCRDANGLNLIHKAAGLGHTKILEYLIGIWPDGAAETDITGKTPLHWAASHKNNMRCYTLLTEAGCDEEALDYKMKSPTYYRHKPHEIERAFLVYVPEAPRVSPDVATDWEALSEDIGDGGKKLDIKIPDTNGFHGRNTDDSIENTSEVDLNDGVSATDEEPQTAAITNGNGDDSAPQTPAEDDEEAANGAEEGGEEEPALTNGAAETNDVNGHDGAEVDVEVEDTEAAKAEAAVDADAEAEAQADVGADIKADVEADAQANPEVEATEAEQKDEHENENEAATDSENETNNGYESDNEPAVDTASEHEAESEADENDDEVQVVTEPQTADKLDENHNEAKYDNGDGASSPTSSLAIEGFVTGASEDNRVQSQSAAYVHEVLTLSIQQSDIREAIEAGDMEQLAQIVLNGDGKKLVNMHSHNPDIQAFLSNVPNYMSKIRRVHEAAREGSLLALQQALDRRKFAIAKDDISPNGATPLHVAVLFGNTDIVRYLAARFPETTTITDNDGRTALHYAATINDNGHFYNVLTQLGANSKALDKLGHTPEFYQNKDEAKDILNYKQLLSNFGAEELEDELLNDQVPDDLHSSRRQLQDVDINRTLDRCFSVIEESSKALSGSAASALAHRKPLTASTLQVSVISYLSRFLKRSVFEKIRLRQTRLDHNLFDVIWPSMRKTSKVRLLEEDISCGIIAPDFDVYVVFQEFLVPLIKDMHCMSVNEDFKPHPRIAFFPMENAVRLNTAAFIFDDESNLIQRCTVECSRNLEDFELPVNLTIGQVEQAERMIMGKIFTNHFVEAIGETESGSYYTLTEILEEDSEIYATLQKLGLLIPLLDMKDTVQGAESLAFNGSLWPYGRGVYINSANNLALWLNCQEHLRVISTSSDANAANMGVAYTRVGRVISFLERELHFKESYFLGYLQARPAYLGTGLKFTTTINLPNLMKEVDNLRHLCSVRGLNLITCATSKSDVQLVNMQSLGVIEYVLFQDYCTAVTNIVSLEKDMSLTNSKHIASMLVKIFRRKKNSLVERN
ncbi:uncharacterized protein LOC126756511 isoform X10 [Bactrocera neohumeralis]|uniref:uncharacterized protein LOC126756511 isoform X10 n=1 Tax=Bactrocera neohumeralis TaxID=98809 RepID=UPI0021659825|nr:uncharacterized protein LOC126756511 isoform X10 [Bactrocera neohumeralis]